MYFNKNSSKIIEALHESAGSYKITGKTLKEFYQNLEKEGYKLDSAERRYVEIRPKIINGDRIILYDKDGQEYRVTFNYYSDGRRELISFQKER